jgi:tRNA-modifying protein YgfZ
LHVGDTTGIHADALGLGESSPNDIGDRSTADTDRDGATRGAQGRAIVADISNWTHFTLSGRDGPKFVQGLTTNDILALQPGSGCYTAFLNVHGRIEAVCSVFRFADEFLLQTPPEASDWLAASLGRFVRAGDFRFARLDGVGALTIQGPESLAIIGQLLDARLGELSPFDCREERFEGNGVRVVATRRSQAGGADIIAAPETVASLWRALTPTDGPGVVPVGSETLERLRMEAGIPKFGLDFDNDTVLQEVDVPDIVSFTKGCYLGQEIVARLHYLGQPSKLLRRLEIEGDALPEPGAAVLAEVDGDRKAAGVVTSALRSPTHGILVFAVVKRKYNGLGAPVFVRIADESIPARVVERGRYESQEEGH